VGEEDVDGDFAAGEGGVVEEELGAVAGGGGEGAVGSDLPVASVGGEALRRDGRRGFLETFSEDQLAVDPAVDLVVDVFDAGAGEVAGDGIGDLIGVDGDRGVLRGNG